MILRIGDEGKIIIDGTAKFRAIEEWIKKYESEGYDIEINFPYITAKKDGVKVRKYIDVRRYVKAWFSVEMPYPNIRDIIGAVLSPKGIRTKKCELDVVQSLDTVKFRYECGFIVYSSPQPWVLDIPRIVKGCGYVSVHKFSGISVSPETKIIKKELEELITNRMKEYFKERFFKYQREVDLDIDVYIEVEEKEEEKPPVITSLTVKCPHCGRTFEVPIPSFKR